MHSHQLVCRLYSMSLITLDLLFSKFSRIYKTHSYHVLLLNFLAWKAKILYLAGITWSEDVHCGFCSSLTNDSRSAVQLTSVLKEEDRWL